MELWLLGAGAVVLVAITLWIVWPAQSVETVGAPDPDEEDMLMTPQDEQFEDRYTSATADLSAGGVAAALESMQEDNAAAAEATPTATPTAYGAAGEPWSSPTLAREGATDAGVITSSPASLPEPQASRPLAQPRTIGIGAAVALAIGSALLGAWLYARWQRRRNAPVNRARRRLRQAQKELASAVREMQKELGPSLRKTRKELRSSRFADAVGA
jgi:hypothetical protein